MMDKEAIADEDELAIFINKDNEYRILVPSSWSATGETQLPSFAYLVISSLLRLATRSEAEFQKSMFRWAQENFKNASEAVTEISNNQSTQRH